MIRQICLAVFSVVFLFSSPAQADTLIDNIQGITIGEDGQIEHFSALLIDNEGRVKQRFQSGERLPQNIDAYLDGEGKHVIPGIVDSHLHIMGLGFAELTLDLSDTNSLEEAQSKIAAYAAKNPSRRWILGRGWNQEKWGLGRFPTAAEIDTVISDKPVWLIRVDGHAGWANSEAMKIAEVDAQTKAPAGGRIIRKEGSRTPSGIFIDGATALIASHVTKPRPEDRDLAFLKAQEKLLKSGVTAVADMGTTIEDWQAFRRAGDSGQLNIRIMSYADGIDQMELIGGPGPGPWLYNDRLRMNGVKLYLDGALGSRGAWLKQEYSDDKGNKGLPLLSQSQLRNRMSRAALDKFQVAVHAIGDAANFEVIDAINVMSETYTGDRRWRIEHAQIVDAADLARIGDHGTIASMQPVHQTSDREMAEKRLDAPRLTGAYAWRSIATNGARLAFGSDAPVESPDPFAGIATAISRTDAAGEPFGGWMPSETISRQAAFAAYTSDGAYAGFGEGRFGRLIPGERADFLIIDRDLMLASPAEIRETKVLSTWIAGVRVYASEGQ